MSTSPTEETNADSPADPAPRLGLRWAWPAVAVFALSLVGLGAHLAEELAEGESFSLDTRILLGLRVAGHPDVPIGPSWLLQSAIDVSALGGFTLMWLFGVAGLIWLIWAKKRAEAAWIAVSMIGASMIDGWLKHWIARPRPALVPHLAQVTDLSFPSGHAMVSAAVYLTLALMLSEGVKGWPARLALVGFTSTMVLLIGCSRIYLGVHWPSDVLAGWCFGTAWALFIYGGNRWWRACSQRERPPAATDDLPLT
jgi:undecaprenyl-diphosphatase